MSKALKISIITVLVIAVLCALTAWGYLVALPKFVSSPQFEEYAKKIALEMSGANLTIAGTELKTSLSPNISFKTDRLMLTKNEETLLNLEKFDTEISFKEIFSKKIILKKLGAEEITADVNSLQNLKFKEGENKESKPSEFNIDFFGARIYLNKCAIAWQSPKKVKMRFFARKLLLEPSQNPKFVHFGIYTDLQKDNEKLRLFFKDKDNVYIKDNYLIAENFKFKVNKSEVTVNAKIKNDKDYKVSVNSDKFEIKNVVNFLNTNLLIPNGSDFVSSFKDMKGDFNFALDITPEGINGNVNVNKISMKLIPLADIPYVLTKGTVKINPKDIEIKDVSGYYGTNASNNVKIEGTVFDYNKTADANLIIKGNAYDEFARYVSKVAGIKINLQNKSEFAFLTGFDATGKVTVKGGAKIPKGSDILFEGMSISPTKFDRAVGVNLELFKNILNIEHLNYYISENISGKAAPGKPMVTIKGKTDVSNGYLHELAFIIPKPLPSEFFNVIIGQNLLRRGTVAGDLKYVNGQIPYLDGNMDMEGVIVRGQKFFIRNAKLRTNKNTVNLVSEGVFRRTKYKFSGNIENRMLFPIVIKDTNFDIDNIDLEQVEKSFAPTTGERPRPSNNPNRPKMPESEISTKFFEVADKQTEEAFSEGSDEPIKFQKNLVEVKDCNFHLKNGIYKTIKFGNLHAKLTLSPSGILEIKSNRFDFADGISSLKFYADLAKENYNVKLGAKNVDTDAIATSILNLNKEIAGKANAFLEFNTDSSMKLNGKIKFNVKDGSIAKLGIVQYILNVASVFRNPFTMISPSTLVDIVNIPDGNFKKIDGTLEISDNIVKKMMIKSSSPQLSAFIIGQINLENMDSSLRIYTKFSGNTKGLTGFLRSFSLNSLARKVTPKDTVSYYAAELAQLPELETGEENAQVFLTKVDGDLQSNNFISLLKKIK